MIDFNNVYTLMLGYESGSAHGSIEEIEALSEASKECMSDIISLIHSEMMIRDDFRSRLEFYEYADIAIEFGLVSDKEAFVLSMLSSFSPNTHCDAECYGRLFRDIMVCLPNAKLLSWGIDGLNNCVDSICRMLENNIVQTQGINIFMLEHIESVNDGMVDTLLYCLGSDSEFEKICTDLQDVFDSYTETKDDGDIQVRIAVVLHFFESIQSLYTALVDKVKEDEVNG